MSKGRLPVFEFNVSIEETLKYASNLLSLVENEIVSIGMIRCQFGDIKVEGLYFSYEDSWQLKLSRFVTKESMIILRPKVEAIGGVELYSMNIKKGKMTARAIDGWLNYVEHFGF